MPKRTTAGNQSDAWKAAEKEVRDLFIAHGFHAERVLRGDDHSVSDWDVRVAELPFLVIDSKYKSAGFSHHTLFEKELVDRYCKQDKTRRAIMPTKSGRQRGMYATIQMDFLVELLAKAYLKRKKSRNSWPCNNCGTPYNVEPNHTGSLHRYSCPSCQLVVWSEYVATG